jgi:hypothetical protein
MDTGTAIFLASLPTPLSVLVGALWNNHKVRIAAEKAAKELVDHTKEVTTKLKENTALTEEIRDETKQTREEMNGMKDALIKAEKKISFAAGEASQAAKTDK